MKKLLFFINTLEGGGAEKVIVDLVNSLDASVYDVTLVTVSGGVHKQRLLPHITYRQLIRCKNKFLSKFLQRFIFHLPKALVYRLVAKGSYDFEIAYLEGFPTKVITASNRNTQKIAFVHCDVSVKPVLRKYYRNKKICLKEYSKFEAVCFVSELAKNGFYKTYGFLPNARVVHNVINVEEIQNKALIKNDFAFQTNGLKIISVGRLSEEKAFDRLIRIAAQLEQKYDFEICILGEGASRQQLESLIWDLDVKSVRLLGFQENPYAYMKKADLFICSSLYEGYSTTVTECMILGIPVLTTECAGMDEILNHGEHGIIIKNDESKLLNTLEKILLKPSTLNKYMCENVKEIFISSILEYDSLFE